MFLKIFLCLTFNLFILSQYGNCENCDSDEVYLHLFGQIENLKRSLEIVNTRLDILYDKSSTNTDKKEMSENPRKKVPSIFDIRFDSLPKHCLSNAQPSSCAAAMECTRTSGIYNITDYRYSNQTFSVYCDYYNYEGDWTYVLRRKDGTEQFNRTWNDYVKGFGSLASEYWLGLDHLYALTNFYGPQELIVHIESFDGIKKFARYDNFAVGSAAEKYKLKSLGEYSVIVYPSIWVCNFLHTTMIMINLLAQIVLKGRMVAFGIIVVVTPILPAVTYVVHFPTKMIIFIGKLLVNFTIHIKL
ncbi:fibroleukin-like [Lucilia sericata]|uniref:fibroleukin-like n=1 Tax=Lucilia sericata TaxID=13632 RepID=UPI0018A80E91|nr:fibroleukin-like [Lucilia sericata]